MDMLYGFLRKQIREKVPRCKVANVSELLDQFRLVKKTFEFTASDIRSSKVNVRSVH